MALKWDDIDLNTGVLQVQRNLVRIPSKLPGKGYIESQTKTKKSRRSIVIASFALEALREHRSRQLDALQRLVHYGNITIMCFVLLLEHTFIQRSDSFFLC